MWYQPRLLTWNEYNSLDDFLSDFVFFFFCAFFFSGLIFHWYLVFTFVSKWFMVYNFPLVSVSRTISRLNTIVRNKIKSTFYLYQKICSPFDWELVFFLTREAHMVSQLALENPPTIPIVAIYSHLYHNRIDKYNFTQIRRKKSKSQNFKIRILAGFVTAGRPTYGSWSTTIRHPIWYLVPYLILFYYYFYIRSNAEIEFNKHKIDKSHCEFNCLETAPSVTYE